MIGTAVHSETFEEQTLTDLLDDGLFVDGDWVETKDQDPDGEVRLIQLADIGDGVFRDRSARFLTSAKANELGCTFLQAGDVLVARMPEPLGRACIFPGVEQPAVTAVDVCVLRPNPDRVRPEWLVKAINSPGLRSSMQQYIRGTTRQRISRRNLGALQLRVPPVGAQLKLASTLDRLESTRRRAWDHVTAARRALGRFRLAALAGAYGDALRADEKGEVPLTTLLREPLRNGYSARPVRHETPFRVLKLTATTSGQFDPRHFKFTDEVFAEDSPLWLGPGDILVQRGNTAEFVGVPAIYEGESAKFLYPDLMIRVRVRPDVSPRFVWYMLLAPQARNYLRERATGSAGNMPKINQEILANVPLPLPQLGAQEQTVEQLDAAFAVADSVERLLDVASLRIERSSQAILGKAFRGELAASEVVG